MATKDPQPTKSDEGIAEVYKTLEILTEEQRQQFVALQQAPSVTAITFPISGSSVPLPHAMGR
jgi:hypothetical protein